MQTYRLDTLDASLLPTLGGAVRRYLHRIGLLLLVAVWIGGTQPLLAIPAGGFADDPDLNLSAVGAGWHLLEKGAFSAGAQPGDVGNERFVVFAAHALDQVEAEGILPASEAQEIRDELAAEGLDYRKVEDTFVIHLEAAEDKANQGGAGTSSAMTKGDCWGWQAPQTSGDDWSWNHPGEYNIFEIKNDYFDGSIDVNLPVDAQVDASVEYKVKKAFCLPYKFRLIEAVVSGHAELDGSITADAELKYTNDWKWKKNIYTVHLGSLVVNLGPVPVYLQFKLPLDIGINTKVDINGEAHLRADIDARAEFNVTCTASDCNGTSSITRNFDIQDPQLSLQLEAEAEIWAKASVRMDVYDDSIANASVGAKGYVKAHLFGYYGNMCGDGDGNGTNEYVSALLLDVNAGYKVDAKLGGALLPDKDWKLLGDEFHLANWDLLGSSTVLTPMISGPENPDEGTSATYTFKTRPCYPYDDDVTMRWTGPVSGTGSVEPTDGSTSDSAVIAAGTYTLQAYPESDTHGRTFGSSYSSQMNVYAGVLPPSVASSYDYFGRALAAGDFDCDGFDDLAVGVPYEDVEEKNNAGMVTIYFANPEGGMPTPQEATTKHIYSRPQTNWVPANARFGSSLVTADFNNDGCSDLAVGAPGDYGSEGIAHALLGDADRSQTLGTRVYLYMATSTIPGTGFPNDKLGSKLAAGDVDGDGYDDLAITIPGFDVNAGAVALVYGRATGIGYSTKNTLIYQDTPGVPEFNEDNDGTNMSVAIGDFNNDGFGDLAIGYPYEDHESTLTNDGYVVVLNGTASGPATSGNVGFGQSDLVGGGSGAESEDRFGFSLAAADFDGDGIDDLAIASPYEDWGSIVDTGLVQTVFGSFDGLTIDSGVNWNTQSHWGHVNAERAYFGFSLEAADYDGDGLADLAIGAYGASLFVDPSPGLINYAGQVHVGYGQPSGGDFRRQGTGGDTTGYVFSRITYGFDGPRHASMFTGYSLGAGDFDGDGSIDLAIGSQGTNIDGKTRAGSVNVLYGDPALLSAIGSVHLYQD